MRRLGKRALTPAEKQARYRNNKKKAAELKAAKKPERQAYQPVHGYNAAKAKLIAAGHHFERARREWGFEAGVFVDGALLGPIGFGDGSESVLSLADMTPAERKSYLDSEREATKQFACDAVESFMEEMRVTMDELTRHLQRHATPP